MVENDLTKDTGTNWRTFQHSFIYPQRRVCFSYEYTPPTELNVKRANSKRVMERQAKQARSKRFVPSF